MARPRIEQRLKDLLDETRLVMLGTQLLVGLQYQAAFSETFENLPPPFIALTGVALLLVLTASAFQLAIPSLHEIGESGQATGHIIAHASFYLRVALLPLACALGLDIAIGTVRTIGSVVALAGGSFFVLTALIAWYLVPFLGAERSREDTMEDKEQSVEVRLEQGLTELRVILPGAQALFGFQFTAILTQSFDRLPATSKAVHLVSLGAVALTVILLIAPAAYHRIAAKGNAEERMLTYTTRTMLCALGLLAVGFVGDSYVTVRKVSGMSELAFCVAALVFVGFAAMLYAIPLYYRFRRRRRSILSHQR